MDRGFSNQNLQIFEDLPYQNTQKYGGFSNQNLKIFQIKIAIEDFPNQNLKMFYILDFTRHGSFYRSVFRNFYKLFFTNWSLKFAYQLAVSRPCCRWTCLRRHLSLINFILLYLCSNYTDGIIESHLEAPIK